MLYLWLWACQTESIQSRDWTELYLQDSSKFQALYQAQDAITQQNILLSIVDRRPETARELCPSIENTVAKQTCTRYIERPHLQSIDVEETAFWNGGRLQERLFFPREYALRWQELEASMAQKGEKLDEDCLSSLLCVQTKAEEVLYSDWQKAALYCHQLPTTRGQSDCLFHASEALPVHLDNFLPSTKLCVLSGAYAAECHNHLLLRYASAFGERIEWHQSLVQQFYSLWDTAYASEIEDAYWSIVSVRVVGMFMPLELKYFQDWPAVFMPHLRSVLALRVIQHDDPLLLSQRAWKGESLRVQKVRGPGAPFFSPHNLWPDTQEGITWIRFCDIRGGNRPVHSDADIDMVWALLTASAMMEPPVMDFWESIDQEKWEIRWAMAHIVKEVIATTSKVPSHMHSHKEAYQHSNTLAKQWAEKLSKDPDIRVRRAL